MLHGYFPAILEGLRSHARGSAVSLAIACLFGLIGASAKLSGSRLAAGIADAYTTLIRGSAGTRAADDFSTAARS